MAYRDEDRVILAGKLAPTDPGYYAPTTTKKKKKKTPTTRSEEAAASPGDADDDEEKQEPLLRQAIGSPEKLLDPPYVVLLLRWIPLFFLT